MCACVGARARGGKSSRLRTYIRRNCDFQRQDKQKRNKHNSLCLCHLFAKKPQSPPAIGDTEDRVSSLELVTSNITDIGSTKTAISVAMPSVDYLNHLRGQALSATCCSILPLNYAAAAPTVFLATRSPVKQMLPAGEENQSKLTVTKKSDKISEWICTLPFVGSGQTCVQLVSIGSCNEIVTICSRNATFDQVESKTYNHFQNHCNVGSVNKN